MAALNARLIGPWMLALALSGATWAADAPAPTASGQGGTVARGTLARGEHIARAVCSACHVVAPDQEFPPLLAPPPPSFAEIAGRPGTTAANVRQFVLRTHWDTKSMPMKMPDLSMRREDAAAVASYLVSLRKG